MAPACDLAMVAGLLAMVLGGAVLIGLGVVVMLLDGRRVRQAARRANEGGKRGE